MIHLYDLPEREGIKIFCECSDGSSYIVFGHIDGLYSYCTSEKGTIAHLSCNAQLDEVEGGYKLNTREIIQTIGEVSDEEENDDEEKNNDDGDDEDMRPFGGMPFSPVPSSPIFSGFGGGSSGGGGASGSW